MDKKNKSVKIGEDRAVKIEEGNEKREDYNPFEHRQIEKPTS